MRCTGLQPYGGLQVEIHAATSGLGGNLSREEIHVIQHALDLTSKTGHSPGACTPLDQAWPCPDWLVAAWYEAASAEWHMGMQVFMVPNDAVLDEETLLSIIRSEHSKIPVYEQGDR